MHPAAGIDLPGLAGLEPGALQPEKSIPGCALQRRLGPYRRVRRNRQCVLVDEILDHRLRQAEALRCGQHHVEDRSGRQHRAAEDPMVAKESGPVEAEQRFEAQTLCAQSLAQQRVRPVGSGGCCVLACRGGSAIWLDPESFVLERVGRQADAPAAARLDPLPADRAPLPIEGSERRKDAGPIRARLGQRTKPGRLAVGCARDAAAAEGDEGGTRADFEKGFRGRPRSFDRLTEANRLSDLAAPIEGVGRCGHRLGRQGRDPPNFRRRELDGGGDRGEPVEHRLHQRRMKRVRGLQRGRRQPLPAAALDECCDRLATA